MAQESIRGWGGQREGAGRGTRVPVGTGERSKVTVTVGEELLELLRERYPDLGDQDLVRAGLWAAVGRPIA